jgi:trimeric autotransporter adhesin
MKTKILSGLICCLGIFSANAQTITAPIGQPLTITNSMDMTLSGGRISVPIDGAFTFGTQNALSYKSSSLFVGPGAGNPASTGTFNVFIGENSGVANTVGEYNFFMGSYAGYSNQGGNYNTCMGSGSGRNNINGQYNTYIGLNSGFYNTQSFNMFLGGNTGSNNTGSSNVFIGPFAGVGTGGATNTSTGSNDTYIGTGAGESTTTGSRNVFLGTQSGKDPNNAANNTTTGSDNVFIGYRARGAASSLSNAVAIGSDAVASVSNTVVLGNAATTITGTGLASGSGLKFANLTSASSPATGGAGKVLSVDATGNVILVGLTGGAGTTAVGGPVAENWKEADGYLYNNSTNGVVIKGTGLDGNSLIVKGGVLSKEVNVKVEGSESWPDYVFKPNYKRLTLGEVEKFISINGHLPNIPSATEMAATGNNLGKTDVKLLEKVEELTLYLLDMKKANDAQAAELKALKQQVSKLRKK